MSLNDKVGIDAISFDIPKIYLPIRELATARNIEPDKLEKGLGLLKMAFPDIHQDIIVFAANALNKLLNQENLTINDISRIYVATESGIDSSKPIGSYLLSMMESIYGENTCNHCDVVDMTFACISGVDALHNCLDYTRVNPESKSIVICTDFAKYDLESGGEYTQGAGSVALLISKNPRIISIENNFATSTKGVFDFFKPKRIISKKEITGKEGNPVWMNIVENEVDLFKEQPVFDGQYSNACYQERLKEAYFFLKDKLKEEGTLYKKWHNIIVHLPYSFQGRRMFSEIYALDSSLKNELSSDPKEYATQLKDISKTEEYKNFVKDRFYAAEIASSNIGNMYTGSIFMGLISTLNQLENNNVLLEGERIGFLSYGSGSKSKAFEGTIEKGWQEQIKKIKLLENLENRIPINMEEYESIYKKEKSESIISPKNEWILESIESENPLLIGARYYKYIK